MAVVPPGSARHLPGFSAPGVGFEQPFAMLQACHERVLRTLALLARLRTHVLQHGVDDDARQAARDVQRYFDIACRRIQAAIDAPDMFVEAPKPAKQEAML